MITERRTKIRPNHSQGLSLLTFLNSALMFRKATVFIKIREWISEHRTVFNSLQHRGYLDGNSSWLCELGLQGNQRAVGGELVLEQPWVQYNPPIKKKVTCTPPPVKTESQLGTDSACSFLLYFRVQFLKPISLICMESRRQSNKEVPIYKKMDASNHLPFSATVTRSFFQRFIEFRRCDNNPFQKHSTRNFCILLDNNNSSRSSSGFLTPK
jgi:hypothetical protein